LSAGGTNAGIRINPTIKIRANHLQRKNHGGFQEIVGFRLKKDREKIFGRLTDRENQIPGIGSNDLFGIEKHQRFGKAKTNGIGGCLQAAEVTRGVLFLIEWIRSVQPYNSLARAGRF
jgi:hypothetical protein